MGKIEVTLLQGATLHCRIQSGVMQDENVACRDRGKVLFKHAVGCFGTVQLDRATRSRAFSTTI